MKNNENCGVPKALNYCVMNICNVFSAWPNDNNIAPTKEVKLIDAVKYTTTLFVLNKKQLLKKSSPSY